MLSETLYRNVKNGYDVLIIQYVSFAQYWKMGLIVVLI